MHNQLPMGKIHCRAYLKKNLQPAPQSQPLGVAVGIDRPPIHQLHHQIRQPILAHAAVEKCRDLRMSQLRQNLALPPKTLSQHR